MNTVANERRKLLATLLNTLAAGSVITGVFAPAAACLYGVNPAAPYHWWLIGPLWLIAACTCLRNTSLESLLYDGA